ncbi:hypothetical protein GGX14DRAFT_572171 [Mycena pura]|uniref:Uncharacterized protein n=1 Tax=Mycena pura TaxID=153505 RepID=A0AAD6YBA5_9AGAR|nr:hypothetical protein GGX14DRAFT_572171 [Mycena pura]
MSSSVNKDHRCIGLGLHHAPVHLSKAEFEAKINALVDTCLALPVCQRNFLKFELMFPTDLLSNHIGGIGSIHPPDGVWVRYESPTHEHLAEVLTDPEFHQLIADARDWGLDCDCSFSADVSTKTDVASSTPNNRAHGAWLIRIPSSMSGDDFQAKMVPFFDKIGALPVTQKNVLKLTYWSQNTLAADAYRALGYPTPEPVAVIMAEYETFDDMAELMQDEGIRKLFAEDNPFPELETWCFSMDVVTKVNKG